MAQSAFDELRKPLRQAKSTLSRAQSKGLRTIAKNAKKVKDAKTKVKERCQEWRREQLQKIVQPGEAGSQGRREQQDRPLSLPGPSLPSASEQPVSAYVCATCQEGVTGGFEMSCCEQRLHERCLVAYAYSDSSSPFCRRACPCCRRAWPKPLQKKVKELCQDLWQRTVTPSSDMIVLFPNSKYHTRMFGRVRLQDGRLDVHGWLLALHQVSFKNDAIHSFVRQFLGGRWPQMRHTMLRIVATSGEQQALRFKRFENRFWAEPVVVLEYATAELQGQTVVLPLSSVASAVDVNPWRAEDIVRAQQFNSDTHWILQLDIGSPSVVTNLDFEDDLVQPWLRVRDSFWRCLHSSFAANALKFLVGPVELTRPGLAIYDNLGLLEANRVVKLTDRNRTGSYRILGFQGEIIHAASEGPSPGYEMMFAGDVLQVSAA
jgi:hypothetical protein